MYDYIPNEFSRTWVASSDASRRGYYVPLAFIDILGGDRFAAEIFAQIMYWHQPDDNGKPRMSCVKDGYLWVAKNYREWFNELRIVSSTARKAIETLVEQGMIFKSTEGFAGEKTPWIRVNWAEFQRRMTLWLQTSMDMLRKFDGKSVKDAEYRQEVKQYTEIPAPPVTTGQGAATPSHTPDMSEHPPLLSQGVPNTETRLDLQRLKDSAATSAAMSVNFFWWMRTQVDHAIQQLGQPPKPAIKPTPAVPTHDQWTRERQNEIFNVIALHSFDIPDPTQIGEKKGVGARIGKCVAVIRNRAPKITVQELELFYNDWADDNPEIHAPQDDGKLDGHFTAWWQRRMIRLLDKQRKPRATKPLGIGVTASMAQEPEVSHG